MFLMCVPHVCWCLPYVCWCVPHVSLWCLVCQCAVPRPHVKVEMGVFLQCAELNPKVNVQVIEVL